MKIGLVSCTKKKKSYACAARELYSESTLFRYASSYCETHYDKWYILSARHGLIHPDHQIAPYDETLKGAKIALKKQWAEKVEKQLFSLISNGDVLYFHAGNDYTKYLISMLEIKNFSCNRPLEGISMFKQPSWYKNRN